MVKRKLKRSLGLTLVTLYGIGNILGAGIYALLGKVAGEAGLATPLAFLLSMLIALITAFSYMELVSRYPVSAGVSAYLHHAFGRVHFSRIVGLLMIAGGVVSASVLAKAFGGYFSAVVPIPAVIGVIGVILVIGLISVWGISESAKLAAIFTFIELIGLGLILYFGRTTLSQFVVSPAQYAGIGQVSFVAVLSGVFLAFYAYIGVEDIVNIAEETKKPSRVMPLAILISSLIMGILYISVAIVAVHNVSPAELAASQAPLTLVFSKITQINPLIISLIGMSATINGLLAHMITGSRVIFGMSRNGLLHERLGVLHHSRKTPTLASLIVIVLILTGAIFFNISALAKATTFLILTVFVLVNFALIFVKLKHRSAKKDTFKVPLVVPILGLLSCVGMIGFEFWQIIGK